MSTSAHDLSKLRIDRDAPSPAASHRWVWAAAGVVAITVSLIFIRAFLTAATPVQVVLVAAPSSPSEAAGATAVTANGYVVARTRAAVAAKIPGRLATLEVGEGSFVRKGAEIARLENADYVASVEESRANVASAQAQRIEAEADRDQMQREADRLRQIGAERPELTAAQEVEATRLCGRGRGTSHSRRRWSVAMGCGCRRARVRGCRRGSPNSICRRR